MSDSDSSWSTISDEVNKVLDNGSHRIKAGIAGDDSPSCVIPNVIGYSRNPDVSDFNNSIQSYIGDYAIRKKELLSLTWPIERGIICNWDAMEKIWTSVFMVTSTEQGVLITEPPFNPKSNREMMAQILFEKFDIPRFYVALPALLSFYANGRDTGICVDIGENVTHIAAIYNGYFQPQSLKRLDFGGKDLTQYLQGMLVKKDYCFTTLSELEDVRLIKEHLCYVNPAPKTIDFSSTQLSSLPKESLTLSDGYATKVCLDVERVQCPEPCFNPSLIGGDFNSIQHLIHDSIMSCDTDIRSELLSNIILSGSTTMFRGFADRLRNELKELFPKISTVCVIAPPERRSSVWIGGSVLASLTSFQNNWITKEQYEEQGPYVVHGCL